MERQRPQLENPRLTMTYKHLNLIRSVIRFPFIVVDRTLGFLISPLFILMAIVILLVRDDWQNERIMKYTISEMKKVVSFGFWK